MASPGLRERKRAETERRLAATAHALVRDRGLGVVTVDDIVEQADVSRRTFSNYYSCKEEAVAAVIIHRAVDGLATWRPEPATERPDAGSDAGGVDLVGLVRSLVAHQFGSGALAPLVELSALAAEHRQLVPHVREAQWRLWTLAGERAAGALDITDARRQGELDAILGAVFGVVSAHLARASGAPGVRTRRLRALVEHTLDLLETGYGEQR